MLNEKTLELNITGEMLELSRQYDKRAFAFGTTLTQESNYGYDSRVLGSFPHLWKASVLQYKRATKSYITDDRQKAYVFHINNNTYNDQHELLCKIAGTRKNISFYVLPAYIKLSDLKNSMPNPLNHTYFADATDIPVTMVNRQPHELHVFPARLIGVLYSKKETSVKLKSSEEFGSLLSKKKIGITIAAIRDHLLSPLAIEDRPHTKRPRFLFNIFPTE